MFRYVTLAVPRWSRVHDWTLGLVWALERVARGAPRERCGEATHASKMARPASAALYDAKFELHTIVRSSTIGPWQGGREYAFGGTSDIAADGGGCLRLHVKRRPAAMGHGCSKVGRYARARLTKPRSRPCVTERFGELYNRRLQGGSVQHGRCFDWSA